MFQDALWNVVVVDLDVIAQRRLELCGRSEPDLIDDVADTAVEALDHAVGLRMAWRNKPMLDIKLLAQTVEYVAPARLSVLALGSKTVGELAAVIGKQFNDLDRASSTRLCQKVGSAILTLVSVDVDEHPARGAIDGDEQVAPGGFILYLGKYLISIWMKPGS